jgi:Bacterial regulatory proteins, gntR family
VLENFLLPVLLPLVPGEDAIGNAGKLHPGEYLSEFVLLERFHGSRTPIRETLIHLYKEGLLQKGRFKGYVTAEMSIETLKELSHQNFVNLFHQRGWLLLGKLLDFSNNQSIRRHSSWPRTIHPTVVKDLSEYAVYT